MTVKKLTNSANTWLGTTGNDNVDALAGNDTLDGSKGDDTLLGGKGNDLIAGGEGKDTLNGNDDNDVLDGGVGTDKLFGDAGNDIIYGGSGFDTLYGGTGNDYLFGGVENDILYGGTGSDLLEGGDGADILADTNNIATYGAISSEQDEMIGGLGADIFYGGYDTMWGNDGNDIFNVKNQGTVRGGVGDDKITVSNSNAKLDSWLEGGFGSDTIISGAGNDTLFSGYGFDKLQGGAGNDHYVMTFDGMKDTIIENAGGGTDTAYFIRDFKNDGRDDDKDDTGKELDPPDSGITAYNYKVTLPANVENGVLDDQAYIFTPNIVSYTVAKLTGNALNNRLQGSALDDILDGGKGNDTIMAGDGDDVIFAGKGTDSINGGAGVDLIASIVSFNLATQATGIEEINLLDSAGAAKATGTTGNNRLIGNKFNNILEGGAGNDILDGFYSNDFETKADSLRITGIDTLIGGTGSDLYRIDSVEDKVIEIAPLNGTDTVEFKGAGATATDTYVLPAGVENLTILGKLQEGDGNNLNNRIIGDSTNNILKGGYGDDYLDGGSGTDKFEGGYGDDTFLVDNTAETITEAGGQGSDWAQSDKINLNLSSQTNWVGIENARLTGTLALDITGQEIDNILIGNKGSNRIEGGGGIDTLEGGLGNDTYVVNTTTDKLNEVVNELDRKKIKDGWIDTIESKITFDISKLFNFENLALSENSNINGTGNRNDNDIRGNAGNNVLKGLEGNDTINGGGGVDALIGGTGDDTYTLSNDNDIIKELANEGKDTIIISNTFVLSTFKNIENLTLDGTIAIDGQGTDSENELTGNSAGNVLTGLGGDDTLIGKDGADTLIGGKGSDVLNLTESKSAKDVVRFALGDSLASANEVDKVIKFATFSDTLDLPEVIKIAPTSIAVDGENVGTINSHKIINGIITLDDTDSFVNPTSISVNNLSNAIEYLKQNITDQSTVAFQVGSDLWVFQDSGATDTLVTLVGVSGVPNLNAIHIT